VQIGTDVNASEALISSGRLEAFRAVRAPVAIDSETAALSRDVAEVLGVRNGDLIRIKE
jgi:arginine N-succinyltransferase